MFRYSENSHPQLQEHRHSHIDLQFWMRQKRSMWINCKDRSVETILLALKEALTCLSFFNALNNLLFTKNVSLEDLLWDLCGSTSLSDPCGCELFSYSITNIHPRYLGDIHHLKEFYLNLLRRYFHFLNS